jgi:hypothetical protein
VPATSTYCNLDPNAYGLMVTAFRTDLDNAYAANEGHSACGMCARVTSKTYGGGNGNSVVVHIIDHSNDYGSNGGERKLDMAPQALSQLGDYITYGALPVDFEIINCP